MWKRVHEQKRNARESVQKIKKFFAEKKNSHRVRICVRTTKALFFRGKKLFHLD